MSISRDLLNPVARGHFEGPVGSSNRRRMAANRSGTPSTVMWSYIVRSCRPRCAITSGPSAGEGLVSLLLLKRLNHRQGRLWATTPDYHRNLATQENWLKDLLLGDRQLGRTFNLTHRRRVLLMIVLTFL
jgi:hypothetical protein